MAEVIKGRPDFGNPGFGVTEAQRHPKYVYSTTRMGSLVHKVAKVEIRWWSIGPGGHSLIRSNSPQMTAHTVCGQMKYIAAAEWVRRSRPKGRARLCEVPAGEAILCGRCHGEPATFGKDGIAKQIGLTRQQAAVLLGCDDRGNDENASESEGERGEGRAANQPGGVAAGSAGAGDGVGHPGGRQAGV